MDDAEWVLNRNEGIDVVHPRPFEVCNSDQAKGRTRIDPETADALIQLGQARMCEHCGTETVAGGPTYR